MSEGLKAGLRRLFFCFGGWRSGTTSGVAPVLRFKRTLARGSVGWVAAATLVASASRGKIHGFVMARALLFAGRHAVEPPRTDCRPLEEEPVSR
jgi:hypothetical protein